MFVCMFVCVFTVIVCVFVFVNFVCMHTCVCVSYSCVVYHLPKIASTSHVHNSIPYFYFGIMMFTDTVFAYYLILVIILIIITFISVNPSHCHSFMNIGNSVEFLDEA